MSSTKFITIEQLTKTVKGLINKINYDVAVVANNEESMKNVKLMLSKYGLNTTTDFTLATADTAAADGTVLAE